MIASKIALELLILTTARLPVWSPYPRPVSGSDLGRYVELDPESGLIGISSSSSIRFRVPLKKFFYVIFISNGMLSSNPIVKITRPRPRSVPNKSVTLKI